MVVRVHLHDAGQLAHGAKVLTPLVVSAGQVVARLDRLAIPRMTEHQAFEGALGLSPVLGLQCLLAVLVELVGGPSEVRRRRGARYDQERQ